MTRVLFRNRWQATKLRGLQWLFLAIAVGTLYAAADLYQFYGLAPADGGVLRPFPQRAGMAALVAGLGVGSCIGFLIFGLHYPIEIRHEGDRLEIDVLTPIGRHTRCLSVTDVRRSTDHHGQFISPRGQSVSAPWLGLHVAGRRFPYVVDLQAEEVRVAEIEALAEAGLPKKRSGRKKGPDAL